MWGHKHPVHALVHPCITVACAYCYHTHLAVSCHNIIYMYTTTQPQAATSVPVQSCTVCVYWLQYRLDFVVHTHTSYESGNAPSA